MTDVINTATVMPKNTELSLPDINAVSSVEMRETIKNVEIFYIFYYLNLKKFKNTKKYK